MGELKKVVSQLGSLGRDRAQQSDMEREFEFHVEMETNALIESGMSPEDARRKAMLSFGGTERYQEEMRDGWIRRALSDLGADVRFALRGLRRTPIFTATAVITLAVGLGGAAAVFTLVNKVLIAPLPYEDEDRIVRIFQQNSQTNRWSLSVADVQGIEQWQRSFSSTAAIRTGEMALSGRGDPTWVRSAKSTTDLFATFGIRAARGRTFNSADGEADAAPVVVISDALAKRHYGGVESVGQSMVLDGVSHTVVGVLSPELTAIGGVRADVWPIVHFETPTRRGPFGLMGFAKLKAGVTLSAAAADLAAVSDKLLVQWEKGFSDKTAKLTPFELREIMLGDATKSLGILFGAVILVLLIALANVTNLVLVRATGRKREIALRVALGAGRSRLTRLLLTENIVLAVIGGVLAVAVSWGALKTLRVIGPALPRMEAAELDAQTIAFTLLLALASGVVIALYPMAFSSLKGVAHSLRSGDRSASVTRGARTFQNGLVVAEFALALPLFAAAALLLNSFLRLQDVNAGVDPTNVASIRVSLPSTQYGDAKTRTQFWVDALREVSSVPGVKLAGISGSLPPDNQGNTNNFDLVDKPVRPGDAEPTAPWSSITPGYFDALGVKLIAGRTFDVRDDSLAPPVLIVSKSWADHWFPGESALGKTLIEGGCVDCPRSTVVGIVPDIKYGGLAGNGEGVYIPYAQGPGGTMFLVVRGTGDVRNLLEPIRARIHAVDPNLPLVDTELMSDHLAAAVDTPRHWTLLVGGFALIAVILAALGVFGVMSYIVQQQQREIGVRLALGAAPMSVLTLVLRRGLVLAGIGTAIGIIAAVQGTRLIQHVLFDVSATDPRTFAGVATLLLIIATVACYFPGRRASKVDPVRVMTAE